MILRARNARILSRATGQGGVDPPGGFATRAEGTGPASAPSQAVTPQGGAAVGSVALRATPNPVPTSSSGTASSALTAQVEDGQGHALSGRSVTLQVPSGGCRIAGLPGTTNALGNATATLEQPAESLTADAVCPVTATSAGAGAPYVLVTFQGVPSVRLRPSESVGCEARLIPGAAGTQYPPCPYSVTYTGTALPVGRGP